MQRWNNDEDATARNNWNAEAKENQQLDSGGPDHSQSTRYQPTITKTRLFKCIEHFTPQNRKFSDKNSDIFQFLLKI